MCIDLLLSASLLVLIACGPGDDGPTGAPDAEGNDASVADTSMGDEWRQEAAADATCNALLLDASCFQPNERLWRRRPG
jgi:hypothetical protein